MERAIEHPGRGAVPQCAGLAPPKMDGVILAIGTDRFSQSLFEAMQRSLAIRQMVIHRFKPGAPVEPLALECDRRHGRQLHSLVDEYVRRFHPQDPFRRQLLPSPIRSVNVRAVSAPQVRDTEYRERLFTRPGISSKLSILVREREFALSISLYKEEAHGVFGDEEAQWLGQSHALIAAAVQRHYSLISARRPDDLASFVETFLTLKVDKPLSVREAAVCARIVKGYSNEAIALDLGVSFHSVATYRRRAYSKLGVTSQNEVFRLLLRQREATSVPAAREAG